MKKKIIKAMAILHMINRNEEVPVRKTEIRLATGLNMADFVSSLEKLESKKYCNLQKQAWSLCI